MLRRALVVAVCALGFVAGSLRAEPPFRYPEGKCDKGELRYINGLPVLTVAGTPEEMGNAIGTLALKPGRKLASYPEELLKHVHISFVYWPVMKTGQAMVKLFPTNYRAELDAMAKAASVDR